MKNLAIQQTERVHPAPRDGTLYGVTKHAMPLGMELAVSFNAGTASVRIIVTTSTAAVSLAVKRVSLETYVSIPAAPADMDRIVGTHAAETVKMGRRVIKQTEVADPVPMDSKELNVTEIFASHQRISKRKWT